MDWHGESYKVEARVGETLLDTAKRYWLPIPGKCDGGDGRVGDVNDFAEGFISYFDILKYFSPDLQVLPVNFVTCSSTVPTCTRSRSLFLNCAYSIILSFDSHIPLCSHHRWTKQKIKVIYSQFFFPNYRMGLKF